MRPTGYKLDPSGHQRTPFARLAERLSAVAPSSASLLSANPPVIDQGQTSSCTGHAAAIAFLLSFFFYFGNVLDVFLASAAELYRNARAIDRTSVNEALTDDGANANQLFRAVEEYGLKRAPNQYASDVSPLTINDEPKLGALEEESTHRPFGVYAIAGGSRRTDEIKLAIASGIPVCAAIAGGSDAFQNYAGGVLGEIGEPLDHYIVLVAYDTTPDGGTIFKLQNSWGSSWGEHGYAWIDESACAELGDVLAVKVKGNRS